MLGSHVPCGIDLGVRSPGSGGSRFGPRDVSSSITVYIPSDAQASERIERRRRRTRRRRRRRASRKRRRFRGWVDPPIACA